MDKEQKEFHRQRRIKFMEEIGDESIAFIVSNSNQVKSFDEHHSFKQNKNFYYLTGFEEPNSALLLIPSGYKVYNKNSRKDQVVKEILFVQEKDPESEAWNGERLGAENVKDVLGIECGFTNFEISRFLSFIMKRSFRKLYVNLPEVYSATGEMREYFSSFLHDIRVYSSFTEMIDPSFLLGQLRAVKQPYEIKKMKKAVSFTAKALNETLKQLKPALREYQVQAFIEYNYRIQGSEDNAFSTICASGSNACVLHYITNRDILQKDELLLIDTGAESSSYCSDITRTYPISGKFSKEQRQLYDLVLKANKHCIEMIKPGVAFSEVKNESERILGEGLVELKIIKNPKDVKKYYIHGIGHHLGLDTHDAVPYGKGKAFDNDTLKEGMVLTIEPGLYIPVDSDAPKKFRGIGIRIEDDVLVTGSGYEVLSSEIIKEADEIESAMAK